jgi:hypothetical protein
VVFNEYWPSHFDELLKWLPIKTASQPAFQIAFYLMKTSVGSTAYSCCNSMRAFYSCAQSTHRLSLQLLTAYRFQPDTSSASGASRTVCQIYLSFFDDYFFIIQRKKSYV